MANGVDIPVKAIAGGILLVVLGAIWGLLLFFPVDTALTFATRQLAEQGVSVRVQEAERALFGLRMQGVQIGENKLNFDEVVIKPSASVLWMQPGGTFSAQAGQGTLEGAIELDDNAAISVEVSTLRLASVLSEGAIPFGLSLDGVASGAVDLKAGPEGPLSGTAGIGMTLERAKLGLPELLNSLFSLEVSTISFDRVVIKLDGENGVFDDILLQFDGEQMNGTVKGKLETKKPWANSTLEGEASFQFDPSTEKLAKALKMKRQGNRYVRKLKGPLSRQFSLY